MDNEYMTFKADDGEEIFCRQWFPEVKDAVKAVVQVAHGMAEHSKRYGRFARILTKEGFAVFANDHRGHGQTAGSFENAGHFADDNGWRLVVEDMRRLSQVIKTNYPSKPIFLFGHSMGSFLLRHYIALYGTGINGAILSGTGGDPGLQGKAGHLFIKEICKWKGRRYRSRLLKKLFLGKFNNAFKPNRTEYDWLSRDNAEVDKYVKDPFCGGDFTSSFFDDFLHGIIFVNKNENIQKAPKELPIYLFSGEKDPVGKQTKGVKQVFKAYQKAGIKDVQCRFYKDGRHEMLNETNREEVFGDIIKWLDSRLTQVQGQVPP